ncbi:MAG: triphosphoribosyl-dephospho-CoA synthase [Methylophilus sp.]|jgi:triphosphoribosyl-dephospho-CoA synthase
MHNLEVKLSHAYKNACLAEIEAIKPGNVHIYADGHGMVVQDFIKSAEASASIIAQAQLTLGERIFLAVQATWQAVECNTNLGIVLLCAPLIHAAYLQQGTSLQERLPQVLNHTTQSDAELVFAAIQLANPAGLGASDQYDVHQTASGTLLQAMQAAEARDSVALQYSNGYAQIINEGLPYYQAALQRWQRPAWAATALYLYWLAHYADSHIVRKYNLEVAQQVQAWAQVHEQAFIQLENPKHYLPKLMQFDADLKQQGLNPGTSADLTVATLLLQNMIQLIN